LILGKPAFEKEIKKHLNRVDFGGKLVMAFSFSHTCMCIAHIWSRIWRAPQIIFNHFVPVARHNKD
jgi:hypothetical protein